MPDICLIILLQPVSRDLLPTVFAAEGELLVSGRTAAVTGSEPVAAGVSTLSSGTVAGEEVVLTAAIAAARGPPVQGPD